jgi:hypothetical protein
MSCDIPWIAWVGSPGANDWHSTYSDLGRPGTVRGCGGGNGWGEERCKLTTTKAGMKLKETSEKKRRQPVLVAPRAAYVELPRLSNIIGDYMRVAPAAEPLLEPPSSRARDAGEDLLPAVGTPLSPCREASRTRGASPTASAATSPARGAPPAKPATPVDSKHLYGQIDSSPIAGFPDSNRYMTESKKAQLIAANELLRRNNQELLKALNRGPALSPLPSERVAHAHTLASPAPLAAEANSRPEPTRRPGQRLQPCDPYRRVAVRLSDAVGSPTMPRAAIKVVQEFAPRVAYMPTGRMFADKTTNLGLQRPIRGTQNFTSTWQGASLIGGARNLKSMLSAG